MTDTDTTEITPFSPEQTTRAAALGIAREVLADGGAMFSGVKLDRTVNDLVTVADYIVGQPAPEPAPERSPSDTDEGASVGWGRMDAAAIIDQLNAWVSDWAERTVLPECYGDACSCREVKPDENAEAKKLAERILAMDEKRRKGFEQRVWLGFDGAGPEVSVVEPEAAPFRNRKARRAAAADAALAAFRAQK